MFILVNWKRKKKTNVGDLHSPDFAFETRAEREGVCAQAMFGSAAKPLRDQYQKRASFCATRARYRGSPAALEIAVFTARELALSYILAFYRQRSPRTRGDHKQTKNKLTS